MGISKLNVTTEFKLEHFLSFPSFLSFLLSPLNVSLQSSGQIEAFL